MKRDERIDPDTAPMAEIRAMPYIADAVYLSCAYPDGYWPDYRRHCWESAINRLRIMEQL